MKWYWWGLIFLVLIIVVTQLNRMRVKSDLSKVQLGPNFNLSEFVKTSTGVDNIPGPKEIEQLRLLVINVLQPLRNAVGKPISITSGYRSPSANALTKGSSTNSQHMKGQAADIVIQGMTNQQIIDLVRSLKLPYDQLIDEQLWKYDVVSGWRLAKWVHVSFNGSNTRYQWMTARNTQEDTTTRYTTVKMGIA